MLLSFSVVLNLDTLTHMLYDALIVLTLHYIIQYAICVGYLLKTMLQIGWFLITSLTGNYTVNEHGLIDEYGYFDSLRRASDHSNYRCCTSLYMVSFTSCIVMHTYSKREGRTQLEWTLSFTHMVLVVLTSFLIDIFTYHMLTLSIASHSDNFFMMGGILWVGQNYDEIFISFLIGCCSFTLLITLYCVSIVMHMTLFSGYYLPIEYVMGRHPYDFLSSELHSYDYCFCVIDYFVS